MLKSLFVSLVLLSAGPSETKIAFIANHSVPVDSLSVQEIRDIYTLTQQKWRDNQRVVTFNLKANSELKKKFYDTIGQRPLNLRKLWMRFQLTGEGHAPEALRSQEEMLTQVTETEGGVGFVSPALVDDNVKVLAIIE